MIGRLRTVVIDSPEPHELAEFYAELLGLPVTNDDPEWVVVGGMVGQPRLAFQRAPGLLAPDWPDPERPQQLHLDVAVDDIDTAEPEVVALGARRLPGEGDDFKVFADPAGHPFCLVWDSVASTVD